jgi:hypothetical protein
MEIQLAMKKLLMMTAALALLTIPGAVQAYTITFSNLAGANEDSYTGSTEGGFAIAPTGGTWLQGQIYGNPVPSILAGPIGSPTNSTIQITGGSFIFASLDFSSNNGGSTYDIQGFVGASMVYDLTGNLTGSFPPFSFHSLLGSGTVVDRLSIEVLPGAGTTSINLDNIVVNAPDSGGSLMLLGIGLAGLIIWRGMSKFAAKNTSAVG